MLALDGNTAPYLQYAYARIRSIFRRAGTGAPTGASISISAPAERALVIELRGFGSVIAATERILQFHRIAGHLHAVASTFSVFYEHCPVLHADDAVRTSRLDLTARVLRQGLHLVGIATPDRM